MQSHRATITSLTALAIAVLALTPATAQAGSLLSGYGGPGQGNQEILGSTLLGGGSSGGSSGGQAGVGSSPQAAASGTATSESAPAGGVSATAHGPASHAPAHAKGHAGKVGDATTGAARAHEQLAGASTAAASVDTPTLGLSSTDVLYILIALAVLAMTGGLTVGVARRTR